MIYLTFVRLKKKKIMFLIPIAVFGILLPIISITLKYQYEYNQVKFINAITQHLHLWIPVFSSWWIVLLYNDFFDNEGNELLYLYHRPIYFLHDQCFAMFLYSIVVGLFFSVFKIFVDIETFVLIQIIVESLVISSLAYLLCFAFQNTGIGLLIVWAYCIYIILFDDLKLLGFMSIFPETSIVNTENIALIKMSFFIAVLFLVIGFTFSKVRHEYK